MTKEQQRLVAVATAEMRALDGPGTYGFYDAETAHVEADNILVRLLRDLGAGDLCDAFEALDKWYS